MMSISTAGQFPGWELRQLDGSLLALHTRGDPSSGARLHLIFLAAGLTASPEHCPARCTGEEPRSFFSSSHHTTTSCYANVFTE